MINTSYSSNPKTTHTVKEFIVAGSQKLDYYGYLDLSYMERREGIEYIVKNVIDEYYDELVDLTKDVELSDWSVMEYRYNPKKLSNKLYKTTRLWHMILRLNGLANVHEFDLTSHKLKLLEPVDMRDFMNKVYSNEQSSLQVFKNRHKNDSTPIVIERFYSITDDKGCMSTL